MNCDRSGSRPARKVRVINDRGAGDAFMAGIIYGYLQEMSIEARCQFALATAALAVTHEKNGQSRNVGRRSQQNIGIA